MAPLSCRGSPTEASPGSLQRGAFSKLSAAQLQALALAEQNAQRAKQQRQKVTAAVPAGQATKRDNNPQDRFDYRPMRRVPEGPVARTRPGAVSSCSSGKGKGVGCSAGPRNTGTKQFLDHPVSGSVVDRVVFHHDTHSHGDIANFDHYYAEQGLAGKSSWGTAEYEPEYRANAVIRPPPLKLGLKPLSQCALGREEESKNKSNNNNKHDDDRDERASQKPQRRRIEPQQDTSDDAVSCTFDFRGKKMVPPLATRSNFDSVGAVVFGAFDARLLYPPTAPTPEPASKKSSNSTNNDNNNNNTNTSSAASVQSGTSSSATTTKTTKTSSKTSTTNMSTSRSSVTFSSRPSSE
mmetsp:Transcript_33119/g.71049  ORF Transcript_33119/g.71049 Transcript_33119/m.71049 type:complete len:351 (+) Transcript_33119:115-1167(+)